ncbi:MAG: Gfo/Idh/MocA family oxidoreductase [Capsulimonadaceae bacterium]|nr:Gfo/Idh/MocA family oxidoreductase [Capsulimonadaceae bacterium]
MNIGIIGAGGISLLHASAYRALKMPIVAVADLSRAAFDRNREQYGDAIYCSTTAEMLADPNVDIVDICVNTRFHADLVRQATGANKHIFCEKTMTESGERAAELVAHLQGYGKCFQVGYMKRFFPATRKAVELLPEIGQPFSAYIRSYQGGPRGGDPYDDNGWKPRDGKPSPVRTSACGGMLNMAGSHMLDLMGLFLGEPESVSALCWMPAAYDAETNSHALFRQKNGCIVHFEAALSPYSCNGEWGDGWDECVRINGTRGTLELFYTLWNKPSRNAPLLRVYSEDTKTHTEYRFPIADPFALEMAAFAECCRTGSKAVPGVAEGYYVDKIISAVYESADRGETVRF